MIKLFKGLQIRIDLIIIGLWILIAGLINPHFVVRRLIKANFKKVYNRHYNK